MAISRSHTFVFERAVCCFSGSPHLPFRRGGGFQIETALRGLAVSSWFRPNGMCFLRTCRRPRQGMAATVYDGRVYLIGGGARDGFEPSSVNEVFVP